MALPGQNITFFQDNKPPNYGAVTAEKYVLPGYIAKAGRAKITPITTHKIGRTALA